MRGSASPARDQAPIVHRSETEICFRVDPVTPCQERLPLINARKRFEEMMGRSVQVFTHEAPSDVALTGGGADHSLVSAVYLAFSEHRPLVLTPDAVWITLAQGLAQHINHHADALRSSVVTHQGTVTLRATTWELANSGDWADVIQQWSDGVQPRIPADLYQLMLCDFSTTTPIPRTVSQVVMLDALQQYFDYRVSFICGIPTITVKGSVHDWITIRERVDVMAGFHLEWWTDRLKPICDGFIDTANGHPSQTFWRHIFSPKEVYGGDAITGWLADLFPYIKDSITHAATDRNPILAIPREQLTTKDGLSSRDIPVSLSRAPFTLKSALESTAMELIAGFMGVKQDADSGQLEPAIGWAVLKVDAYSQLLTRLGSSTAHDKTKERTMRERHPQFPELTSGGVPKEFIQLMDSFGNGQEFFSETAHSWDLKPISDLTLRQVSIAECQFAECAVHFMDLSDGRAVGYVYVVNQTQPWWIILGTPDGQGFQRDSVRVIAKGFVEFMTRLVHEEGRYYFDDPSFHLGGSL
jgi:hypothetical protein